MTPFLEQCGQFFPRSFQRFAHRFEMLPTLAEQTSSSGSPASSMRRAPIGSTIAATLTERAVFVALMPSFSVRARCTASSTTPPLTRTSRHVSASASSRLSPAPTMQSQHGSNGRSRSRGMARSTVSTSQTAQLSSIAANGSCATSATALVASGGSSKRPATGLRSMMPSMTAKPSIDESARFACSAVPRVGQAYTMRWTSMWRRSPSSTSPSAGRTCLPIEWA